MLRLLNALAVVALSAAFLVPTSPTGPDVRQGEGLIIELDLKFIEDYENRSTITSEYKIAGLSAVHRPDKDGEVHVGGWAYEAGLPCVAEVMNAAHLGTKPRLALAKAFKNGQEATVTGAWRLWGEHAGTGPQVQKKGPEPSFPLPGEHESNPDHVFEIHPVTSVKAGTMVTDAAAAIGNTPGITPYDAQGAFVQGSAAVL
jgi:hypothetical protein